MPGSEDWKDGTISSSSNFHSQNQKLEEEAVKLCYLFSRFKRTNPDVHRTLDCRRLANFTRKNKPPQHMKKIDYISHKFWFWTIPFDESAEFLKKVSTQDSSYKNSHVTGKQRVHSYRRENRSRLHVQLSRSKKKHSRIDSLCDCNTRSPWRMSSLSLRTPTTRTTAHRI